MISDCLKRETTSLKQMIKLLLSSVLVDVQGLDGLSKKERNRGLRQMCGIELISILWFVGIFCNAVSIESALLRNSTWRNWIRPTDSMRKFERVIGLWSREAALVDRSSSGNSITTNGTQLLLDLRRVSSERTKSAKLAIDDTFEEPLEEESWIGQREQLFELITKTMARVEHSNAIFRYTTTKSIASRDFPFFLCRSRI